MCLCLSLCVCVYFPVSVSALSVSVCVSVCGTDDRHCSHFCANTHRSLLLPLSLVLAFVYLCFQMQEHQNLRPSTGTLHYTLPSSSMMTRSPRLCIHWSPPKRLTAPRPQALRSVHSNHTAPSAHLFLRAPLAVSQAKQCQLRSRRPSRSSYSLSSYIAATSLLILFRRSGTSPHSLLDAAVQTTPGCVHADV